MTDELNRRKLSPQFPTEGENIQRRKKARCLSTFRFGVLAIVGSAFWANLVDQGPASELMLAGGVILLGISAFMSASK